MSVPFRVNRGPGGEPINLIIGVDPEKVEMTAKRFKGCRHKKCWKVIDLPNWEPIIVKSNKRKAAREGGILIVCPCSGELV